MLAIVAFDDVTAELGTSILEPNLHQRHYRRIGSVVKSTDDFVTL